MTQNEKEDTQTLWKMLYGTECFRRASETAQHIVDTKLENSHPLFYPLCVAVYVLYARPFTSGEGVGKLSDDIVPANKKDVHKELMAHRHEIYAHRDATDNKQLIQVPDLGTANQVRAVRNLVDVGLVTTHFESRHPRFPEVVELCDLLRKATDDEVEKLWKRYGARVPQTLGEYVLNVADETADIWLPAKSCLR